MNVKRRKYRFRILNGGPSRFYKLVLRKDGANQPFTQITASGNLLPRPLKNLTSVELWVAERSDIIIDFRKFKKGDKLYLANTLVMMADGRGIDRGKSANPDQVANQLIEFRVGDLAEDASSIPAAFRPLPSINMNEVVNVREWEFGRVNGCGTSTASSGTRTSTTARSSWPTRRRRCAATRPRSGASAAPPGGWDHPIHVHFEEGLIMSQNGVPVADANRYRTDIYRMGGTQRVDEMEVFMRFRDFPDPDYGNKSSDSGRYVCTATTRCTRTTP